MALYCIVVLLNRGILSSFDGCEIAGFIFVMVRCEVVRCEVVRCCGRGMDGYGGKGGYCRWWFSSL